MVCVCESNGFFFLTSENGTKRCGIKNFFEEEFSKLLEVGGTVYVAGMKLWGMIILRKLRDYHYVDFTPNRLRDGKSNKNPDPKTMTYVVSADNGAFYNIKATHENGSTTKFMCFENLVAIDDITLMRDFEGKYKSQCMYNAVSSILSLGLSGTTISSSAYTLWKRTYDRADFERYFPECDYPREAYHGGLCLLMDGKHQKIFRKGITIDANSLYAWAMRGRLPFGEGKRGEGEVPEDIRNYKHYKYFVHFKATFRLKKDHIPFVRTACDKNHNEFEVLSSSDFVDMNGNVYDYDIEEYVDEWGEILYRKVPMQVELYMYCTEFELFFEHYDVSNIEYIDYVWFKSVSDPFKQYIDTFYSMKKNAKTKGERRVAKMFLNALTGRMGLKKQRRSGYFDRKTWEKFDEKYRNCGHVSNIKARKANDYCGDAVCDYFAGEIEVTSRSVTHVPVAAAITSEAMCYIVRKAQANYKHFIYTDTDSLHLDCGVDELVDIKIGNEIGEFKVEEEWDMAVYYQQKKYFLHDKNNGMVIKFAGLPVQCQNLLKAFLDWKFDEENFKEKYKDAMWEENPFIEEECPEFNAEKPENIPEREWYWFKKSLSKYDTKDFYGMKLPYLTYGIRDTKTYKKVEKISYYKVDLWSK